MIRALIGYSPTEIKADFDKVYGVNVLSYHTANKRCAILRGVGWDGVRKRVENALPQRIFFVSLDKNENCCWENCYRDRRKVCN